MKIINIGPTFKNGINALFLVSPEVGRKRKNLSFRIRKKQPHHLLVAHLRDHLLKFAKPQLSYS